MKATIITIGDEILIGQIVDTNSVSIAKHLNAAGIVVHEKVSIGDDSTQIVRSVERALGDSNVVVITGGLGPTKDDITKKTLAGMFGCELVPDQRVADHVKRMLEGRGIEFNELNRDFQRKQREFREDLNQRRNEELAGVLERANKTIRQIAEAEKYDIIFQEAVYASPRIDITDKVIKALNAAPAK